MADYISRYTGEEVDKRLGLAETALQEQAQADWEQTDDTAPDYIKNKPYVPDEFIAEYGVTTYAEITAALNAGKTVTMNRDGLIYGYCGEDIRHSYRFAALLGGLVGQGEPNVSAQLCLVSSTDEWTNTYAMILTRSDIVTSMDAQSTNTQVPGAKAVYDAIQAAGGGGGMHLITNSGLPFDSEQDLLAYQGPVEDGDIAWVCGGASGGYDYLSFYIYDTGAWSQFFEYYLPVEAVMYDFEQSLNSTQKARARTNIGAGTYSKPSGGIPASDLASGVIPTVPVQDVTVGGTSVVSSGTAVIPAIPSAPGTLNTNNTSAQTAKSSEALSGTIKLHKVSKTGSYNDLLDKPTIPAAQIQSDWDQSDNTALDYIKNKPTIPDTSNFVQKSQTAGLLKNDGTVDTTVYGTYSKPSGGIPKTDLASAVQTSLGLADSAYQKPSGGIPSSDLASAVQTSLGKADSAYQKPSGGIPASDLASGVIPTVPIISTDIETDKASNAKTASPKAVADYVDDKTGDLDDLTTTANENLVAAINEAAASGGSSFEGVEVAVLNTTGTPAATGSVSDGVLSLAFTGIKGETGNTGPQGLQGNSGYSGAAGELEVVNNLEDGGATSALSAEMGKVLKEEVDESIKEIPSIAPVEIVDAQGNIAMTLSDGHIATKKFDSRGFFDPGARSLKQTAATFGSGDTLTIDHVPNVRNKYVLSFMAEISAIGTLKVQYGDTNLYARGIVTINGTTVIVAKHGSRTGTDEYTHGLTFSQYIEVVVRPTIPNHAKLSILTTGGRFDQVIEWAGSSEDIVVSSTDGGSFTNAEVTMSYYGFGSRLWIYGASWTDMFPDLMVELGMPNYLLNGWSGKTTQEGVASFIEDIQRGWGKPDYLLFILGANNPESGQGTITIWQNAYELLIEVCNQYNVQLIGCTIPNTVGNVHTYKNNYIKTCGIRYVDMAAAMGCSEPNSTGYAGVMMDDGKHPTTPVGCMKFSLALLEQINNIITEMSYV